MTEGTDFFMRESSRVCFLTLFFGSATALSYTPA